MPKRGAKQLAMTPERKAGFLTALRDSGGIFATACRVASPHSERINAKGIPPCYSSFKNLMVRDLEFGTAVAEILDACRQDVEAEIHRRGQVGVLTPVYQGGERVQDVDPETGEKVPAVIRKFSDALLLARMRALDPDRYGDKKTVTHRGTIQHAAAHAWTISAEDMECLNDAETASLIKILGKVREHRTGEKQAALEYSPSEQVDIIDAEFEPVADVVASAPDVADDWLEL